jgi:hypothetical protein
VQFTERLTQSTDGVDEPAAGHESDNDESMMEHHPFVFYYAIGICLIIEGLMWIFFHFCPNQQTAQFTSSFLYLILVIATLCLHMKAKLILYKAKSKTSIPHGHHILQKAYLFFMFTVLVNALSIALDSQLALRICIITYFLVTVAIGFGISLNACALSDFEVPSVIRVCLSYALFVVSGILCLFYSVRDEWTISATLTAVTGSHVMAYFFYHACGCRRPVWIIPFFISASLGGWAIWIYLQYTSDLRLDPAVSRALNQECLFMGFYDSLDIFAVYSAAAAFFGAISILAIPVTLPLSDDDD